jgi:hypothetical protein
MIPPWLISTGVQLGGQLLGGLFGGASKRPDWGDTPYARRLKELAQTGSISGTEKDYVIGNTARTAGNVAQAAKANFAGRLQAQGYGSSIAGESKLADIDTQRMDQLSDTTRAIDVENARSKASAATEYAQGEQQYEEGQRQAADQKRQSVISSLAGAAGTVAGGYGKYFVNDLLKKFNAGQLGEGPEAESALLSGLRNAGIEDPAAWIQKNAMYPTAQQYQVGGGQ